MRLYGKRSTEEEITKEVARRLLGDTHRDQDPLSVSEVAITLGYTRHTVYNYVERAVKNGLLEYDGQNGKLVIPSNLKRPELVFRRFDKNHIITKDPLIAEWKQDLLTRKQGEPLGSWKARIANLERLCNTCKIEPTQLLKSNKETENILKNFVTMYREGKATNRFKTKRSKDIRNVVYYMAQAVRDFCGFHGMIWKRGVGGVMSQKVPNHGKYADKRLTEEELESADQFIKSKWGLDSDVYRWFWIGIESCARFSALYKMNLDYVKHVSKKTSMATYIMTAFESKTEHIKGGKWTKYITRPDTQKSIDLLKARSGTRIYESREAEYPFTNKITKCMKEIYAFLGKTEYFENYPTHVLRHIGAHYWLAKMNYNYGLVAMIGGWNTIDELRKSYGEIPPEKVLEMIEEDNEKVTIENYPLLH